LCGVIFAVEKQSKPDIRRESHIPSISLPYNATPDVDWSLEQESAWGEPSQLGGMDVLKREVPGMLTVKTQDAGTVGANVCRYEQGPENEKVSPAAIIRGPRQPPKAARGSWRRSEGRDWASAARSSQASISTVSTDEIFSVRLVQSPNPNGGGLNSISPAVGRVSSLLGGTGVPGVDSDVNVRRPAGDDRGHSAGSQNTIGAFSEGSSEIDYEGHRWELADRMFLQSGPGSSVGYWKP